MSVSKLVSIRQFIQHVPYLPVQDSESAGWENIVLLNYSLPPGVVQVPELQENLLFVSLLPKIRFKNLTHQRSKVMFLRQGDVAITPSGCPQHWQWLSSFAGVNLFIPPSLIRVVSQDLVRGDIDSVSLLPGNIRSIPFLSASAIELLSELKSGSPRGRTYIDTLTRSMVMYLVVHHSSAKVADRSSLLRTDNACVACAIDFITAHLGEDLRLFTISSACNVSVNYLCEVFKQSMGQSVHQFIIEQRIERAKRLLRDSQKSLAEIAQETGFSNQAHLANSFRKLCGSTPSRYRHDVL
jgi:AraC family transcriptional regulator